MKDQDTRDHLRRRRFLIPLFVLAAVAAVGTVVMLLWNAIIPGLTGWAALTWPKAVGLLVLCKLLFGGFRGRPGMGGPPWRHRGGPLNGGPGLRAEWREKWRGMTDEQRAQFREEWKKRCGPRFRSRRWIEVLPTAVRLQHHGTVHALQASLVEARAGRRDRRCSALLPSLPSSHGGLRAACGAGVPPGVRARTVGTSRLRRALERDERCRTRGVPRAVRRTVRPVTVTP